MARKHFAFYQEYYEAAKKADDRLAFLVAIFEYGFTRTHDEKLTPRDEQLFNEIKPILEMGWRKYESRMEFLDRMKRTGGRR